MKLATLGFSIGVNLVFFAILISVINILSVGCHRQIYTFRYYRIVIRMCFISLFGTGSVPENLLLLGIASDTGEEVPLVLGASCRMCEGLS